MNTMNKTVLYDRHLALGAKVIEFGGWQMPLHYAAGIVQEHLETRRGPGSSMFPIWDVLRSAARKPCRFSSMS